MLDLPGRLTDMGGRNLPPQAFFDQTNLPKPGPEWYNYFGDGGSETTLNHVLYGGGLYRNATVEEVMDVGGDFVCGEYFYSDSFSVTTTEVMDGIMVAGSA